MSAQNLDSMSLGDLFKAADTVGEKYQDESYVQEYKARIADLNKEIAEYQPKGTFSAAIAAYGDCVESMDRVKQVGLSIPDVGRGRIGNLLAFMES